MSELPPNLKRLVRRIEAMSDGEVLALHAETSRSAAPIYRRVYAGNWEAGVAASRSKFAAGMAKRADVAA